MRVCRPGGRIGLASWTPAGFLGQLFRLIGGARAADAGRAVAAAVGDRGHILRRCSQGRRSIAHTLRHFAFRYRSPEHWVEVFRTYYGPTHKAFAALDAGGQAALEADLLALLRESDARRRRAGGGGTVPGKHDYQVRAG